jgi:DNA-binding phage protein
LPRRLRPTSVTATVVEILRIGIQRNNTQNVLMDKSTPGLTTALAALTQSARSLGLNDTAWAARAGLRKETLFRLRRRASCDLETLDALAHAVGCRLTVVGESVLPTSSDGHFLLSVDRELEERLLRLCATSSLEPAQWASLGPKFFMAGLAVMLASAPSFDRRAMLALAESLYPGASEPEVFARWLKRSPVRPSRFLPMLEIALRHAL